MAAATARMNASKAGSPGTRAICLSMRSRMGLSSGASDTRLPSALANSLLSRTSGVAAGACTRNMAAVRASVSRVVRAEASPVVAAIAKRAASARL